MSISQSTAKSPRILNTSIVPKLVMTALLSFCINSSFAMDAPGNFVTDDSLGQACVDGGGTLVNTNLFTELDGGSFGTGTGAVDEFLLTNIYAAEISGGNFVNTFTGFNFGDYSIISNMVTARNTFQHNGPIYDPENGPSGRFFVSDPDAANTPKFSTTLNGLTDGIQYQISFWVANSEPNGNPNQIGIFVDGDDPADQIFTTGPLTATGGNADTPARWRKFSTVYTHNTAATSIQLIIEATIPGTGGLDFWLDGINVSPCYVLDADLSITKSDAGTNYTPGQAFSYTITGNNAGPDAADGALITDTIPSWAVSPTWTCTASGGAVCPNASGTGSINETIATFPNGGQLVYVLSGTYSTNMADYPAP